MTWRDKARETLIEIARVMLEPRFGDRVRQELIDLPPRELDRILDEHHVTLQEITKARTAGRDTLVPARLAAAGLDEGFLRQTMPRLFDRLEATCRCCDQTSRCLPDIERADATARLSRYCPNAEIIDRLIIATSQIDGFELSGPRAAP